MTPPFLTPWMLTQASQKRRATLLSPQCVRVLVSLSPPLSVHSSDGGESGRELQEQAEAHKALSEGLDLEVAPLLHGLLPQPSNHQATPQNTGSDISQSAVQWESEIPPQAVTVTWMNHITMYMTKTQSERGILDRWTPVH